MKILVRLTSIVAFTIVLIACTNIANKYNALPVMQAQQNVKELGVWIDVRSTEEYKAGHLEGSINLPVNEISEKIQVIVPDKNASIHLYCRSGRRAEEARKILLNLGYSQVTNHGGYDDLKAKGYR